MPIDPKKTELAISHLKAIKPYDGWSTDTYVNAQGAELITLRRRNVPLSSTGFTAIVHDENDSNCIVGITHIIGETGKAWFCRGLVLVEKDGSVAREQRDVRITVSKKSQSNTGLLDKIKEENKKDKECAREALKRRERDEKGSDNLIGFNRESVLGNVSDMNTTDLTKLVLWSICAMTLLRVVANFLFLFNVVVLPLLVLYGIRTCPTNDSFDSKKELKRVLRGHHLPEGHQNKPANDWLSRTVARVTASVTAEAATALGYEVSFCSIAGICTVATVVLPAMNQEIYWLGIFGSWRYIMKRNLNPPPSTPQE